MTESVEFYAECTGIGGLFVDLWVVIFAVFLGLCSLSFGVLIYYKGSGVNCYFFVIRNGYVVFNTGVVYFLIVNGFIVLGRCSYRVLTGHVKFVNGKNPFALVRLGIVRRIVALIVFAIFAAIFFGKRTLR